LNDWDKEHDMFPVAKVWCWPQWQPPIRSNILSWFSYVMQLCFLQL
jgi:hypothetical protein